jgi:hypothetical protein
MRGPDAGDRRLKYLAFDRACFPTDREKDLLSYLFVRTILKCKSKRKNAKDCCLDVLLCQIKRTSGCICRFERVPRL